MNFDEMKAMLGFDPKENRAKYPTTYNKNTPLKTDPHYSDSRFDEEQTVFGRPAKDQYGHKHLSYDYSDRLWQWDRDKAKEAAEVANKSGATPKSCNWYEAYISAYYGKKLVVEHIISGVNRSNGYPYYILGYREP